MACNNECNSTGLAILPVRYAVVPETISTALPAWAQNAPVTGVALEHGDHYALRALRHGYLYLFYAKGPQGSQYWQCYSIAADGSLWLQLNAEAPVEQIKPACTTKHEDGQVDFFCISEPEKCGDVWIAFSQHKWSEATLKRYKQDNAARDQRMQKIQPAKWINQPQHPGATQATAQALQSVLDYQEQGIEHILPIVTFRSFALQNLISTPSQAESKSGSSEYGFSEKLLKRVSTVYPWSMARRNKSAIIAQRMQSRSKRKDGKACPPLLLPLWDAVGIVHELNAWSMDVAGRQSQFFNEKAFELKTHSDLTTVQGLLSDAAKSRLDATRDRMSGSDGNSAEIDAQRSAIRRRFANQPAMQQQLLYECDEVEQWHQQKVRAMYIQQRMGFTLKDVIARQRQFAALKQQVEMWKANYPTLANERRAQSWEKYEARLNTEKRKKFFDCYTTFSGQLKTEYEARINNVLKWLEARLFITTLQDFKTVDFFDNYHYCNIVSVAINGISNTTQGAALLDRWVQEQSTARDANLLWNTVAGNNPEIKSELEVMLAAAKSSKDDPAPTSTPVLLTLISKAGDLKKYTSFVSKAIKESSKPLPADADWLNRSFNKSDLFLATVGERVFNFTRLGPSLDTQVMVIYKTIFSVRAGVPIEHVISLLGAQLTDAPALRSQILRDLRSGQDFLPEDSQRLKDYRRLKDEWTKFAGTDEGRTSLKTSRLGLLMVFLNALDFCYLMSQLKENDNKGKAALAASGLSAVSLISDLILPAFEKGEAASKATIETIKMSGAILGATASVATLYLDAVNYGKSLEQNRFGMICFFLGKTIVDAVGLLKYLGSFILSAGTLASIGEREAGYIAKLAVSGGTKITAGFAARTGALRLLGILASWEVAIGLIFLQVIITIFSDDDLQIWCERCLFGQKPGFDDYDEQLKELESALKEIL